MVSGGAFAVGPQPALGFRAERPEALLFRRLPVLEDLDFTLLEEIPFEEISVGWTPFTEECMRFRISSRLTVRTASNTNSHTFYLRYVGPLLPVTASKWTSLVREA